MSDDKPKWPSFADLLKDEAFRKAILDRKLTVPFYAFGSKPSDVTDASAKEGHKFFVGVDPAAASGDDATVVYGTYKNGIAYVTKTEHYRSIDTTAQVVEDEPKQLPAPKENEAE